jgi:hypothetical protein
MDKPLYTYTPANRIMVHNAGLSIDAHGKAADRVSEAASFALYCLGIALLIKALRS